MKTTLLAILCLASLAPTLRAGNCCAPAVPQQGVTGETAVLPHTLDLGLHYEYLRSRGYYSGRDEVDDPIARTTDFNRTILTVGYGLSRRFSVTAIVPYVWKEHGRYKTSAQQERLTSSAAGLGDITGLVRYSLIQRDFVGYRELSLAAGLKCPTGSTDREDNEILLSEEMQPGTGSFDWLLSSSYYQGYELFDLFVSATYVITGTYTDDRNSRFRFGNQLSLLTTGSFHCSEKLDLSAAVSGALRGRDVMNDEAVDNTGRTQFWLVPGVQYAILPTLRLQAFFEYPVYQDFNEYQLGSDYNARLSLAYSLALSGSEE